MHHNLSGTFNEIKTMALEHFSLRISCDYKCAPERIFEIINPFKLQVVQFSEYVCELLQLAEALLRFNVSTRM